MNNKPLSITLALIILLCVLSNNVYAYNENNNVLSDEQINSLTMLNYLYVLTQEINASSGSKLFLEQVYSSLYNNTNSHIDTETQYYLDYLLELIDNYRMLDVKRERLEYIYEQNRARAIRDAIPNPLGLLSATNSVSLKGMILSCLYMTVDSISSYENSISENELEYLKDGWELDDKQIDSLCSSQRQLFNYMCDISRKMGLPDKLILRQPEIEEFVNYKNNSNVTQRVQFMEDNQETYKAYGHYWINLAKSYYSQGDYEKCLAAVNTYENLNINIFKKDLDFAEILPLAISAIEELGNEDSFLRDVPRYAELIKTNTYNKDWELRYLAAQAFISLYEKTQNTSYVEEAYGLIRGNVNTLIDEQKKLNQYYIADEKDLVLDTPAKASKAEKIEIQKYNKLIKAARKTELPPIYEPLRLNCDLLFALNDKIDITDTEKEKIDNMLHEEGKPLFLTVQIDNLYRFKTDEINPSDIIFNDSSLTIPVKYLSADSKITVTITDETSEIYTNWVAGNIRRNKTNDFDTFTITFKNKDIKKYNYTKNSIVTVTITSGDEINYSDISLQFKVDSLKQVGPIKNVSFIQVK